MAQVEIVEQESEIILLTKKWKSITSRDFLLHVLENNFQIKAVYQVFQYVLICSSKETTSGAAD